MPKKPLPETPVTNAPPKPKRSDVSDAIYINTNDVEKLLNEIYEDPRLTEQMKPEVKKKALKKIRQEQMQESKSAVRGFLYFSGAYEITDPLFCISLSPLLIVKYQQ